MHVQTMKIRDIPILAAPPPPWHCAANTTLATTDRRNSARCCARIEHATDAELEAVRKALLKLELDRIVEEMGKDAQADWEAGKHAPGLVEAAIREHRAKHPL